MLPEVNCPKCGTRFEVREIAVERAMGPSGQVDRKRAYVCRRCGLSCDLDCVCDVCRRPQSRDVLTLTVRESKLIGRYFIRHCPTCIPPSKLALEWKAAPGAVAIRMGCIGFVVLFFLLILFAGLSHR